MCKLRGITSTLLASSLFLLLTTQGDSQEKQPSREGKKPIVVMVEKTKAHVVWTVDSKVADDPLHALAVLGEQCGHDIRLWSCCSARKCLWI
jgi:hypothetical protein